MHIEVTVTVDVSVDDDLSQLASIPANYRPVCIDLPSLDSTTITFQAERNGGTLKAVHTAVHGSAPAAYSLGTANTGAVRQVIPEDLSRALAGCNIKIAVAQQQSDRSIVLICERMAQ